MAVIPKPITTLSLLNEGETEGLGRPYLGMSSIGSDCMRKLWYSFHWCSKNKHSARINRIFRDGHDAEEKIINDLKSIGYFVFKVMPDGSEVEMTGKVGEEQEEIVGFAGHALGHPDGRVRGVIEAPKTDHLLELKTANDKRFKAMREKGIQKSDPVYYAQCQKYMGKLRLTRTLFVAFNKNDGDYYVERIKFDLDFFEELEEKERNIIMSDAPLKKEFSPTWFSCKMCNHSEVCHYGGKPEVNCRTCDYSDIEGDGVWTCQYNKSKPLSVDEQRVGCSHHKVGWGLM